MLRLDFAVMVIAGTLALVAGAAAASLAIRHRLAADPDLREFVQRAERGHAGAATDVGSGVDAGERDGSSA